jgi:hypothetical protein
MGSSHWWVFFSSFIFPLFPYGIPTFVDGTFGDVTLLGTEFYGSFSEMNPMNNYIFNSDGANFICTAELILIKMFQNHSFE